MTDDLLMRTGNPRGSFGREVQRALAVTVLLGLTAAGQASAQTRTPPATPAPEWRG